MKELAALAYRDTTQENRDFWKNEMGSALREIQDAYDEKLNHLRGELESHYNMKVEGLPYTTNCVLLFCVVCIAVCACVCVFVVSKRYAPLVVAYATFVFPCLSLRYNGVVLLRTGNERTRGFGLSRYDI